MVEVRPYQEPDYEGVKSVLSENDMFEDVWDSPENLREKIRRNPEFILIAVEGNRIVGNIYIVADGWNAYLFRLAVVKEFQGKGVGTLLLAEAENVCRRMGLKEICLLVNSKNEKLKQWYQKKEYVLDSRTYHEATKKL